MPAFLGSTPYRIEASRPAKKYAAVSPIATPTDDHGESLPKHHAHDALASSPERHSNPDLVGPLANRVRDQPVDADRSEQ